MSIAAKTKTLASRLKLDAHHEIERFGVLFSIFAIVGVIALATSGFTAYRAAQSDLSRTALYTPKFTTSKTQLTGGVDGIYTNSTDTKALVMMHFDSGAQISHDAGDYRAFLLGSTENLVNKPLKTAGVHGSFYVFGSTGYVGVLLDAPQAFSSQVLNLVIRANAELTTGMNVDTDESPGVEAGDASFRKYDQWQVFFNPAAHGTHRISALDAARFDPAQVYYQTVARTQEKSARADLDKQLLTMRADLAQITAYTGDMATTKVDGIFLEPPKVPAIIAGDQVTGHSASESANGKSSLALKTSTTVPGGFNFPWRSGNVFTGYLNAVVPPGQSYVSFLAKKQQEATASSTDPGTQLSDMQWVLSDGTDLTNSPTTDNTLAPLVTVMNNLSQAYQNYYNAKVDYQSTLLLNLLDLDVNLRDVGTNSSANTSRKFLTVYY